MTQLGKYQLIAELARGGMGIVYLAVSKGPGGFSKLLIVKELLPELVDDPSFLQMFLEEARLAARLSHPNIVQTYEIGSDRSRHFIVMDYLDGVPLPRILRKKSASFSLEMHLRVICEMLEGLHYAHTLRDFDGTPLGVVHRDVSPQNVFITFNGQAKVVDFGIAKAGDSSVVTSTGVLKGKPAYMAPEQINGSVDARADIYAAGVMIWEAAAGRRMWHGVGEVEILGCLLAGEIPDLASVAPDTPPALLAIVRRAMAKEPSGRHASAADLKDELEEFLTSTKNATMREVASVLGELFAEERATTRATIEAQLAALKNEGPKSTDAAVMSVARPAALPAPRIADPDDPTKTQTAEAIGAIVAKPSSSRARIAAVVVPVLLLLPLSALGVWSWLRRADAERRDANRAVGAAAPAESPVGSTETAANGVGGGGSASASVPASAPSPPVTEAPVTAPRAVRTTSTVSRATPPPPAPVTPPARTARTPPAAPAPTEDTSRASGFLTLDTYPWTHVTEGGRALGDTPLVHVPLPPGTHTLVLENSAEQIRQTTVVTIKSGETVSRRLAF